MALPEGRISADRFLAPRAEPELAFVLAEPLAGPGLSTRDIARAVSHVVPAIEVIDSRIRDWRITIADTIADNASSGAFLLGRRPVPLGDVDPARVGCVLRVGGQIAATGSGAAVLGDPLEAVTWLANTLGEHGVRMSPGDVVLAGALTAAVDLRPGTTVTAEFTGLGHLGLRVEAGDAA